MSTVISMQIHLTKEVGKTIQRPVCVPIPHSIFISSEDHRMCLFCKSEDKAKIEAYLLDHPIPEIGLVLSINDVVKVYKEFKRRKQLQKEYSHFICDVNIMKQLYNALGSTFSRIGDLPVPIKFPELSKLQPAVNKVLQSTYMKLKGKNITFPIGYSCMDSQHICENISEGITAAVDKIPETWSRVHGIHVKTSSSPALPIYGKMANDAVKVIRETSKAISQKKAIEEADNEEPKPVEELGKRKRLTDETVDMTKHKKSNKNSTVEPTVKKIKKV